jgi:hypothetical protein
VDAVDALVEEAAKKAAVAWVAVGARAARLVWCAWLGGSLVVVTASDTAEPIATSSNALDAGVLAAGAVGSGVGVGADEQVIAGLIEAAAAGEVVMVSLRGDHGGRIVTFPAEATRIDPADEAWGELVPPLAGKRLNGSGSAEELAARWAAGCAVIRLTPAGSSAAMPEDAQLETPRPTSATRIPRRPFRLHKVRGATKAAKKGKAS